MTDQEILENAPKGATHIDNKGTSLFRDKKDGIRSLADIKRIVELEAIIRGRDELINNAVSSRIAELEKQVTAQDERLQTLADSCFRKDVVIRDLCANIESTKEQE